MDNADVLVTVVTVCYNSVNTIEKTIKSVLDQSYKNIEYIIIDGASTDGTMKIIEKYRDSIACIVSEPDKGIYYAMNKGIDHASGEIITFLNSDDIFAIDTVNVAVTSYRKSNADVLYGDITFVHPDGSQKVIKYDSTKLDDFHYAFPIPHPGTFVKTNLMREYRFNTDYKISADYELFMRLYLNKHSFIYYGYNSVFFSLGGISNISIDTAREVKDIKLKYADEKVSVGKIYWQYLSSLIDKAYNRLRPIINNEDNGNVVLYGSGRIGMKYLNLLRLIGIQPSAIIDSDPQKAGSSVEGINVAYAKEYIPGNIDQKYLVASTLYADEIKNTLLNEGVKKNNIISIEEIAEIVFGDIDK